MMEEHEKFPWEEKKKKKNDIFEEEQASEATVDDEWVKEVARVANEAREEEEEEEDTSSSSWLPKLLAVIMVGIICYTAFLQVQVTTLRGNHKDSVDLVDYVVEKQVEMSQLDQDITEALIMLLEHNGFEVQRQE